MQKSKFEMIGNTVIEFQPSVVYLFHYRGGGGSFSDMGKFRSLVNKAGMTIE